MSPLACSLFVLAALLAAMDAHVDPYCSELDFGDNSTAVVLARQVSSRIEAHPGDVEIPNLCNKETEKLVAEKIVACNRPNYRPALSPVANHTSDMGQVHLGCPSSVKGCNPLELFVVQYCEEKNHTMW